MIHVTHIITDLAAGGAEMSLFKLLSTMDRSVFDLDVISLSGGGAIAEKIQTLGVPIRLLGMKPGGVDLITVNRLREWIHRDHPNIVQTWMYHADLLGGLAARIAGNIPVVWNIRNGNLDVSVVKKSTLLTIRACAGLSGLLPTKIISCSETASRVHVKQGYRVDKIVVIPNGFDLASFRPDQDAKENVRHELGVSGETPLVGLVARFDPVKDHAGFIHAAGLLKAALPQAHYLLCGDGVDWDNTMLSDWIDQLGMRDVFHLLGYREDIPRLTAALDVATSSSAYGEGFPNIIGEAMSCGVPCVVTDLGDSAYVVGNTGVVVAQRDPQALADGWRKILEMNPADRKVLGTKARQRIEDNFSLPHVTRQYERLYQEIASGEFRTKP